MAIRSTRRPARRLVIASALLAAVALPAGSTAASLRVEEPTGPWHVGRTSAVWTDPSRYETATPDPLDHRAIRVTAWYPTDADGPRGPYLRDLPTIADALAASGELNAVEVAGLGLVAGAAIDQAPLSPAAAPWPVVILSPGNATNVEFYATLAEDLASRGWVVVGVDHPFQSAAVDLGDGRVAVYEGDAGQSGEALTAIVPRRIAERKADLAFVLDHVLGGDLPIVGGAIDRHAIALVGHSNGGVASAEVCADDRRAAACVNIDGQAAGGPLSVDTAPQVPTKPFLFLTKERDLHPRLAALFDAAALPTYRVVVPAAQHDDFTDGPRLRPRLLPFEVDADRVLRVSRGFVAAFLDHVLRGAPASVMGSVDAPTDVIVEVYPLHRR